MEKVEMNWKTTLATLGLTAAIAGCNSSGSDNDSDSGSSTRTIDFNYQVSSLFQQTVNDTTSRAIESDDYTPRSSMARSFTAADIMVGELQVTPVSGGASQTFTWSIYLDDTTWAVESNLSIDLDPGAYDFDLLLAKDDFQYVASTTYVVVDGTNDVPMTISPVIGDLVVNVSAVEELEDFKFQYDATELLGLTDPQIGVSVDGAAEQIFTINPATGLSDAYLNLDDGAHHLDLKLYDANVQVGKSIDAQESVTIVAGQDINMDLVPLHAETQLILTEAGGDANVTVNLPELVADEVGGINNLQTTFSVVGAKNPLQETTLSFNAVTNGYQANFVLSDLQYDDLTVDIKFDEIDSGENIGRCIGTWTLSTLSQTLNCNIELRRRAVIGGSLLAVLGINVLNQDSEPVEGVVIKDQNDNILGITGSGVWGTKGYLKTYLKAGDYTLTAEDQVNNLKGSESKTLTVLDVENVLIKISEQPLVSGDTCASIKSTNPSAIDGVYSIDPDTVAIGADAFDAYCDMTSHGGGWTLVSVRQKSVAFTTHNQVTNPDTDVDAFNDINWNNILIPSTEMYFVTSEGAWGIADISTLRNASRYQLPNSLRVGYLAFHEASSSSDYCYVGHNNALYVTNMYEDCSDTIFKESSGFGGADHEKLFIYVR